MKKTSERHFADMIISNEAEQYNHLMHLATYNFLKKFIKDKKILDYGCGSGYGAHILSKKAKYIVAIDKSEDAINFAKENYSSKNLKFKSISTFNFKKNHEAFDVIVSSQVIEHVENTEFYLNNIYNLLKPTGIFIVTTPNKQHRLYPYIQKPWNIFHLKEYTFFEFKKLLSNNFKNIQLLCIGGEKEFIEHEIRRVTKQKKITLPCTLFFFPRRIVVFLLQFQVILFKYLIKFKNIIFQKKNTPLNDLVFKSRFNINDIYINKKLPITSDLLAICKK
jgi:2-polyprenyl-3-methyl-5-hydroxy-6-metoxy-1,4-benzoquinol methylase